MGAINQPCPLKGPQKTMEFIMPPSKFELKFVRNIKVITFTAADLILPRKL